MATTTRTSVYVSSIDLIKEEVDISDDEIVQEEIEGEEEEGDVAEPYLGERLFELPDFDAAEPDIPDYDPLGTDYDISVEEDENAPETENDTVVQTLMELVDEQQSLVEESENHGIIEVFVESDSDDDVVEIIEPQCEQEEGDKPLIITSVQTLKKASVAGFPSTDLKAATFCNLDVFRCFLCLKDFNTFNDFLAHRTTMKAHKGVQYDSEREKAFLCGICQRPWNQPRKALACAVFGHDASKLHECMFIQRCPHCPETHLGFHSLAAVGRHWALTHPDKKLPQFLYKSGGKDILPSIKVSDRQTCLVTDAMVQANPKLVVENPSSSQLAENNDNAASNKPKSLLKVYQCAGCQRNFETRREVEVHQCSTNESSAGSLKVSPGKSLKFVCDDCGREFSNGRNLRLHLLRAGTCKKFEGQNPTEFPYKCIFCGSRHPSWKSYIVHRSKSHAAVPYNPAMELPFACRICQKPALVEKQAIICGLFGHRSDTLAKEMFKYKCSHCTSFGFHSTFALRRHWEQDHSNLPIPENLQTVVDKPLPTVQITLEQLLSVTRMRLHSSGLVMERALVQAPHPKGQWRTPKAKALDPTGNFVISKEVMPLLTNRDTLVPVTSPVQMAVKPRVETLFVSTVPIPEGAGTPQPEVPNSDSNEMVKQESVEKVMCLTCGESFKDIRRHMKTHDESRFVGQPKHKCWCGKMYHLRNSLYSHWKKNKQCKLKYYEERQLEGKDKSTNGTLIQLDSVESEPSTQNKTQTSREYVLKIPSPQHSPLAGSNITQEVPEQNVSLLGQLENANSNNLPSKVPDKQIDLYAAFAKLDDTAPAVEPIDFDNFIHLEFEEVKEDESCDIPEVDDVQVPTDSPNIVLEPKKMRPSICLICNTGFPNQFMFMKHMAMEHKDVFRFNCQHCGKGFKRLDQLKVHETIHDLNRFEGEPSFACDQCDQKYHLKISLESHRKVKHLGYKQPQSRAHLPVTQHRAIGVKRKREQKDITGTRSHSKVLSCEKTRHSCSVCPRTFAKPFLLEQHKLLHTGEKPHKCDQCGNGFRLRKSLIVHQLNHDPETSRKLDNTYKCFICGLHEFRNLQALEKHRLKQHISIPYYKEKEKPFGCGVCQKPFLLRSHAMVCAILGHDPTSLQTEMFKHKCPECPEDRLGYHSLTSLRDHLVEEHPDFSIPGELLPNQYQVDTLPRITINKQKAEEIKENGPQKEYGFPLVIEFDLFQPGSDSDSDTNEDEMPSPTKSESLSNSSKLVAEDDLSLSTEISREDALEAVKALVLHKPRSNSMPRLTPQKILPPERSPSKRKSNQMASQYSEGSVAEDRALGDKRIAGIVERIRTARSKKSKINYQE